MTASGSSRLDDVPIFIYDPAWIENGFPIGADLPLSRDPIRPPKGARTFSFLKERSISEEVFSLIQDENFGGNDDEALSPRSVRTRVRFLDHGRDPDADGEATIDLSLALPPECEADPRAAGAAEWLGVLAPHAFRHAGGFDIVRAGLACGLRTRTASESTDLDSLIYACHAYENGRARRPDRMRIAANAVLPGRRTQLTVMHRKSECAVTMRRIDDPVDVPLWRALAMKLAERAGIAVLPWTLRTTLGASILLTERFDRTTDPETHLRTRPVLTLSAASLLPLRPIRAGRPGATSSYRSKSFAYLALADILNRAGAAPRTDLPQLWRRMTFSVLLGAEASLSDWQFARTAFGWRLLPMHAVSMLPRDWSAGPRATLDGRKARLSAESCVAAARYFGMTLSDAKTALFEMRRALSDWVAEAEALGASQEEIEMMASVFEDN